MNLAQICNKAYKQLPKFINVVFLGSRTAGYLNKRNKFSCIIPEKGPSEPPTAFQ
jgi:hypothetical protein